MIAKKDDGKENPYAIKTSEVLQRIDIGAIATAVIGNVYRRGDAPLRLFGLCPLCEKDEIIVIWPKQIAVCPGCQFAGNAIQLLQAIFKCNLVTALEHISNIVFFNVPFSKDTIVEASNMPPIEMKKTPNAGNPHA
jgi:DNA primase